MQCVCAREVLKLFSLVGSNDLRRGRLSLGRLEVGENKWEQVYGSHICLWEQDASLKYKTTNRESDDLQKNLRN